MLIFLNSDILEAIKNKELNSREICGLSNIAQAYREQRHYVYGDYKLLEVVMTLEVLSEPDRETYKRVHSRYLSINSFMDLPYRINVVKSIVLNRIENLEGITLFNITLEEMGRKKFNLESHIISESINDCDFYIGLTRFMMNENKSFKYKSNLNYKRIHGSGDDIGTVVQNEIIDGKICLIITDSDKKTKSGQYGDTFKNAQSTIAKFSEEFVGILEMLNVREKENLLPPMLMKLTDDAKHCKELLDDFEVFYINPVSEDAYYYLDLKDGICGEKYLMKKDVKDYIDNIVTNNVVLNIINEVNINKIILNQKEQLFHGISRQVKPVVNDIFLGGLKSKYSDKVSLKLDKEILESYEERIRKVECVFNSFSETHKKEWIKIASLVFYFCCAPSEAMF